MSQYTYNRKPSSVEAFQVVKNEGIDGKLIFVDAPDWFVKAVERGVADNLASHALWFSVKHHAMSPNFYLNGTTPTRPTPGQFGDWVVMLDNKLSVISRIAFAAQYDKA